MYQYKDHIRIHIEEHSVRAKNRVKRTQKDPPSYLLLLVEKDTKWLMETMFCKHRNAVY